MHLREAAAHGKDIFSFNPKARGAEDFSNLAKEVEKLTNQKTWASFYLKGRDLQDVYVIGDFNNWEKADTFKLKKVSEDVWTLNVPVERGKYRYKFYSNDQWMTDPHNTLTENDQFGGKNSILIAE